MGIRHISGDPVTTWTAKGILTRDVSYCKLDWCLHADKWLKASMKDISVHFWLLP